MAIREYTAKKVLIPMSFGGFRVESHFLEGLSGEGLERSTLARRSGQRGGAWISKMSLYFLRPSFPSNNRSFGHTSLGYTSLNHNSFAHNSLGSSLHTDGGSFLSRFVARSEYSSSPRLCVENFRFLISGSSVRPDG